MSGQNLAIVIFGVITLVLLAWTLPLVSMYREHKLKQAKALFRLQREQLEAHFFKLASQSGRPRGLRWSDCEFQNEVTYARDRLSGELSAFVGVAISFEAIEGGDMEEVEAVKNLRAATAVFQFEKRRWMTQGRAIFNLNPQEAIQYYQSKLVPCDTSGGAKEVGA